jgi:hypothetical protein
VELISPRQQITAWSSPMFKAPTWAITRWSSPMRAVRLPVLSLPSVSVHHLMCRSLHQPITQPSQLQLPSQSRPRQPTPIVPLPTSSFTAAICSCWGMTPLRRIPIRGLRRPGCIRSQRLRTTRMVSSAPAVRSASRSVARAATPTTLTPPITPLATGS